MLAFLFVSVSFLVLRRTEPDMPRQFRVAAGVPVGWGAVILSVALLCAFLPGSPSALVWPWEWGVLLAWSFVGALTWLLYREKRSG